MDLAKKTGKISSQRQQKCRVAVWGEKLFGDTDEVDFGLLMP